MNGPLASLRVLDFTVLFPGPFATMFLADLGADVVRVESPNQPDAARGYAPFDGGVSAMHALLGRSKRGIALDLRRPEAVDIVKRLVKVYDIVVEQFRPGVMDRLGVGYQVLSGANPRLIYCSLTGYGQTGPYRDRAGHDINYQALAGVAAHIGRSASGPVPMQVPIADLAGTAGVICGVLAAEVHRREAGEGQFVDVGMFDGAVAWNALALAHYLVGGLEPAREGMVLNGGTFYDYYRTSDGRYLSVACLEPKFWKRLCDAIDRPDLAQHTLSLDPLDQSYLRSELRVIIGQRPLEQWAKILDGWDACAEPVLKVSEMACHPQTVARELIVDLPKPDGTYQRQVGNPIKFSRGGPQYRHTGAQLGEHTEQVLLQVGYTQAELAELREIGVFG